MSTYIAKRILIMIPTFFVISCIVFGILNLSPGRPSFLSGDMEGKSDPSQGTQEVYRIFKRQFHLDKPVLFNTRFTLSKKEVLAALELSASRHSQDTAAKKDPGYFAKLIVAENNLEDWGQACVPQLMAILKESDQPLVRMRAVYWLSIDAQQPLKFDYSSTQAQDRFIEENKEIELENKSLRELRYTENASPPEIANIVSQWESWYEKHQARFQYSFGHKVAILFGDTRFAHYWSNLLRLDFGISHVTKKNVFETVLSKVPYSAAISLIGIVLAYFIAVPLGIFSAVNRGSLADKIITTVLFMLYALPSFFAATLALKYFGGEGAAIWGLFPTGGLYTSHPEMAKKLYGAVFDKLDPHWQILDVCWHLLLPVSMFTYGSLAALSRYARSGLLEVVNADYIRTARAKGLGEKTVILRHMVRNGMIPILTLLGTMLPIAISGSIVIEYIFDIPGIGLLMIHSIGSRDYNVIMCISLISSVLTLVGILISDISYALLDPRIRYR